MSEGAKGYSHSNYKYQEDLNDWDCGFLIYGATPIILPVLIFSGVTGIQIAGVVIGLVYIGLLIVSNDVLRIVSIICLILSSITFALSRYVGTGLI